MKFHQVQYYQQTGFLKNLNSYLESHLSDPSLNVRKILRIVGMSRTNLHNKLRNAIGMSTTEYIRYIRLKRAANLLKEEPEKSICEIAEEVGFNNQSYFTKRFREVFGACPLEFRKHGIIKEHM